MNSTEKMNIILINLTLPNRPLFSENNDLKYRFTGSLYSIHYKVFLHQSKKMAL